eukprot:418129_1
MRNTKRDSSKYHGMCEPNTKCESPIAVYFRELNLESTVRVRMREINVMLFEWTIIHYFAVVLFSFGTKICLFSHCLFFYTTNTLSALHFTICRINRQEKHDM